MDWFFDNFQILALVCLAFASWLKHRSDSKKIDADEPNDTDPESAEQEMPDWFDYDEPWRSESEVELGPVVETALPPPLPGSQPMFSTTTQHPDMVDAELARQQQLLSKLEDVERTRDQSSRQAKKAREARQAKMARPARSLDQPARPVAGSRIRMTLADRSQTRSAIVLREILGPPVGLRQR
ncbi:MAG: hypothetical protein ACO3RV_09190 [Luteolibacter sp.]